MALGAVLTDFGDAYAEDQDRSLVGETDGGEIWAARPGTDDMWEPFDLMKPEHKAAADESVRRRMVCFLDLEYERG